jgi:hypothetical protein
MATLTTSIACKLPRQSRLPEPGSFADAERTLIVSHDGGGERTGLPRLEEMAHAA